MSKNNSKICHGKWHCWDNNNNNKKKNFLPTQQRDKYKKGYKNIIEIFFGTYRKSEKWVLYFKNGIYENVLVFSFNTLLEESSSPFKIYNFLRDYARWNNQLKT